MYSSLGYPIASSVLASVGTLLGIVPFWLFYFGKSVRARSKVAMTIRREQEEAGVDKRAVLARQGDGQTGQLTDVEKRPEVPTSLIPGP